MLRVLLVTTIFFSLTIAASAKFIPYIYFYKYSLANDVTSRVLLASNYEGPPSVDSTNKTFDQIQSERRELIPHKLASEGFDRDNVVILEEPSPISPQFGKGSVEVVSYSAERAVFRVNLDVPKLLFVADPYYFGWRARIDGDETRIFRANYSFRAVSLVSGEHVVEFYHDSWIFKLGLIVGLLGLGTFVYINRARSLRKG